MSALGRKLAKGHIIVFALSLVYFLSLMKYGLPYDEGYLLDGVEKVMEGQLIYRDFHHTYAPGRFYLVAAAFSLAGKHIFVERFIFALLQALKCMLAYLIVRRITAGKYAWLAPVLILAAPGPWHKVFFSSLGLLAVYAVIRSIDRDSLKSYLMAGAVAGACAIFRQDTAGFAVIGGAAAIAVAGLKERRGLAGVIRRWLCLGAGGVAVVGTVLLYFHARGALGDMVHKIAVEGMKDNMTNRIPYPALGTNGDLGTTYLARVFPVKMLFYMPPAVYVLSLLAALHMVLKSERRSAYASMICLFITSVLAFNQAAWRSDLSHLLQSMQFVFVLIPVLIWAADVLLKPRLPGRAHAVFRTAACVLPVALVLWGTASAVYATREPQVFRRFRSEGISVGATEYAGSILVTVGNDTLLESDRAPILVMPAEAQFFSEVRRFLDANTDPGDYVLAVPQLQVVYFLFDRRNPTRYAHYRRALEPDEERRYIEDIERHETQFILLTEPAGGARLADTEQTFGEYAAAVRNYILENYENVGRIGSVQLLRRKR